MEQQRHRSFQSKSDEYDNNSVRATKSLATTIVVPPMIFTWFQTSLMTRSNFRRLDVAFVIFIVTEFTILTSSKALAYSSTYSSTQVYGLYGISLYKSSLVQEHDTSYSNLLGLAYNLFTESHIFQLEIEQEATRVNFQLNDSWLSLVEHGIKFLYRWYSLYFGPLLSRSSWHVKAPPDANLDGLLDVEMKTNDYLKATVVEYGINFGLLFVPSPNIDLVLDARYLVGGRVDQSFSEVSEPAGIAGTEPSSGRQVEMGPRQIFTSMISMNLFEKYITGILGYRYRKYLMSIEQENFKEIYATTYIGLKFSLFFQ